MTGHQPKCVERVQSGGFWGFAKSDARRYWSFAAISIIVYAVGATALFAGKDFVDQGPLSFSTNGPVTAPDGLITAEQALSKCFPHQLTSIDYRVVGGEVGGHWYYACYEVENFSFKTTQTLIVDGDGNPVTDISVLKAAGLWSNFGVVTSGSGLLLGLIAAVTLVVLGFFYYRRPRPGPPLRPPFGRSSWWARRKVAWVLLFLPVVSWILLVGSGAVTADRKRRIGLDAIFLLAAIAIGYQLLWSMMGNDKWGLWVFGLLTIVFVLSTSGGAHWLANADFDYPDGVPHSVGGSRLPRQDGPGQPWLIQKPQQPLRHIAASYESKSTGIPRLRRSARSRANLSRLARKLAISAAGVLSLFLLLVSNLLVFVPGARGTASAAGLALLFVYLYALFFLIPALVAALLGLPVILRWRDPARILVLRPFNRPDSSRPLRQLIRREVAGYGHVYTLADVAIKVRWSVKVPVLAGQLGLFSFRFGTISEQQRLDRLSRSSTLFRRRNLNWLVGRSKVFAVRCADDMWQRSVRQMAAASDVILIDVTDLTGNLAWELDLLRSLGRLGDCIFLAQRGHEAEASSALSRQLGSAIRPWGFDRSGQMAARGEFHVVLTNCLLDHRQERAR